MKRVKTQVSKKKLTLASTIIRSQVQLYTSLYSSFFNEKESKSKLSNLLTFNLILVADFIKNKPAMQKDLIGEYNAQQNPKRANVCSQASPIQTCKA